MEALRCLGFFELKKTGLGVDAHVGYKSYTGTKHLMRSQSLGCYRLGSGLPTANADLQVEATSTAVVNVVHYEYVHTCAAV